MSRPNVLVCGCPRSGTSYLTGVIHSAGWSIGERAEKEDEKYTDGYPRHEDPLIQKTNLAAFRRTDAEPLHPDLLQPTWMTGEMVRQLLSDKKSPWVMKDPAISLVLPMWLEHFDAVVAVSVRHPMATALSMEQLFSVNLDRALKVWFSTYSTLLTLELVYGPFQWVGFPSRDGLLSLFKRLGVPPDTKLNGFKANEVHHGPSGMQKGLEVCEKLFTCLEGKIHDQRL